MLCAISREKESGFDWIGSRNNSEKMENDKKRSYISFGFVEKDFR